MNVATGRRKRITTRAASVISVGQQAGDRPDDQGVGCASGGVHVKVNKKKRNELHTAARGPRTNAMLRTRRTRASAWRVCR